MSTHILVECPEYIVSASLGVVSALKPMEERGMLQVHFIRTADIRATDIVWADILVTVRGGEPLTVKIVRQAKKAGRLIIYYLDDDLLHVPQESLACTYYNDPVIRSGILECLDCADILWGVNPNIKSRYLPMTKGKWIQNKVSKSFAGRLHAPSSSAPLKILYAGSVDHEIIVRELLSPVAKQLGAKYKEYIDFTFIGVDPNVQNEKNIHYIPFIKPYEAYCAFVENGNFRIGLAPGRTDDFFACKYYNKYLEYSAIGAVGVYTNAEPYTQIVSNGVNGILCENTISGWCKAIERLIEEPDLLQSCWEKSREILIEEFSVETVTNELLLQCPELQEYRAPQYKACKVHIGNSFIAFYWGRTALLWRQLGILGVPQILFRATRVLSITIAKGIIRFVQKLLRWNREK